jgi:adenine-specific DNA-methyltransferase
MFSAPNALFILASYAFFDNILDPACGSGAFPMGVLHKLVHILAKLDPNDRLWKERQLEKVDATIRAAAEIDDATIRDSTIADLEAPRQKSRS